MTPPALLFDLDGTLVDSARDIARALTVVSTARGGGAVDPAVVRPLVSLGAPILVREGLGAVAGDPAADLAAFRGVLADLPVDRGLLYPGVEAALTALGARGHAMAIVTNKPERLARRLLADLDLAKHFGAIVGGDTTAHAKPHRAPVDHAVAAIGGKADNCMFIGDSDVDATAAENCGVPFLLFEGGYGAGHCDSHRCAGRFNDFKLLPELVAGGRLAA